MTKKYEAPLHERRVTLTARLIEVGAALVGIFMFIALSAIIGEISPQGIKHYLAPGIRTVSMLCITWICFKFLDKTVVEYYEEKTGKPIPRLIIDLTKILIIVLTIAIITIVIFGESQKVFLSIITAGGLVTAGIAIALKETILDIFAGFVIDVEAPFRKGDWIAWREKEGDELEGKVIDRNWRATYIETHDETLFVLPNGHFLKEGFINLSRPEESILQTLIVSIDHSVPVERAERIVNSTILNLPEIDPKYFRCFALNAKESGMNYEIRYRINDHKQYRLFRHRVMQAVTEQLHKHGLKISESLGEYVDRLVSSEQPYKTEPLPEPIEILKQVNLLSVLSTTDIKKLASALTIRSYPEDEIIVRQGDKGDSMFVIAEGMASVILEKNTDKRSQEIPIATLSFGQFFGERALFLGEKRSATVRAKTSVLVYEIEKKHFLPFLKAKPKLAERLSELIVQRMQELQSISAEEEKKAKDKPSLVKYILAGIRKFFDL